MKKEMVFALTLVGLGLIMMGLSLSSFHETRRTSAEGKHSELGLKTDYGTGCQYLVTFLGGITPRLDASGKQVCRSK